MSSLSTALFAQCPPLVSVAGNALVFDYSPGFVPNGIPNSVTTEMNGKYVLAFNTGPSTVQYNLTSGPAFTLPGSFLHDGNVCIFDATGRIDDFFLPVELIQFEIRLERSDVQVFWKTASEENNAGFELERSFDGEQFQVISALPGMGTTTTAHSYQFLDRNVKSIAISNTVYYRLKQVDWDGKFTYSEVVSLDLNIQIEQFGISRILHQEAQAIQIYYQTADTKGAIISMTDLRGRVVFYQKLNPNKGFNEFRFELAEPLKGMYIIHLTNGIESVNRKLVF